MKINLSLNLKYNQIVHFLMNLEKVKFITIFMNTYEFLRLKKFHLHEEPIFCFFFFFYSRPKARGQQETGGEQNLPFGFKTTTSIKNFREP